MTYKSAIINTSEYWMPPRCWNQPEAWTRSLEERIMDTLPFYASNRKLLKSPGVYLIVNTISQHRYIGSSVDVRRRWNEHRSALNKGKSPCTILQRAWALYGEATFEITVLEYVEKEKLAVTEQRYIDELRPEYNAQPIVDRPGPRIYSAEARAKISAAGKRRRLPEKQKAYMREIMTGRQFTPEWIEHLKEAQARRIITDEDKAEFQRRMNDPAVAEKRNNAIRGKKRTPEQCKRFSESRLKRYQDPEVRMADAARLNTPEARAKRRAVMEQKRIEAANKRKLELIQDESIPLTFAESVNFLQTTRKKFYRLMKTGKIVGHKVGKQWYFYRSDLQKIQGDEVSI